MPTRLEVSNQAEINLDETVSPSVLAGILGVSVPMIYDGRKQGKLPSNSNATYRECIQQYVQWHKARSNMKASSMAERKMLQEIRNGIAKEELTWLDIKEKRAMLIDKQELAQVIEPVFYLIKSGLTNLARETPEIQIKIDTLLRSWQVIGERMERVAKVDSDKYVSDNLEAEIDDALEAEEGFPDGLN